MTDTADPCAIAVMAKAPRAGRVKTRLCPPLQPEEAGALSAAFLRDITASIPAAGAAGYVAYAPADMAHLFDGLTAPGTRLVLADGSIPPPPGVVGFGLSLLHAAQGLFALGHEAACLLNADSPTLPAACLVQAREALAAPGDRVVLGPAEDGGYYLLGMKAPHAHLFAAIDWSTDRVAAQTRQRAASLGLEIVELPVWYDVDDQPALLRLLRDLADQPGDATATLAPATRACVTALRLPERLAQTAR